MSLDFLTRPIGGSKSQDDDAAAAKRPAKGRPVHPEATRRPGGAVLTIGGSPRVDLMPPEVRLRRSQLRTRRLLRLGLFGVATAVVLACVGVFAWSAISQAALLAARVQQDVLVHQQSRYSEINSLKTGIALVQAGQLVGASTEIDWQGYLAGVAAALPDGLTISSVDIDSASPIDTTTTSPTPLIGDHVATLTMTVTGSSLPSVPALLDGLAHLPGYVDAVPGEVSLSDGVYSTTVTMHIDKTAFDKRFASKTDGGAADAGTGN